MKGKLGGPGTSSIPSFCLFFGTFKFFILGRFHIFIVVIVVVTYCGGTMVLFLFTLTIVVKSVQSWDPIQNYFWYQFIKLKDNKYWTKNYQWHLEYKNITIITTRKNNSLSPINPLYTNVIKFEIFCKCLDIISNYPETISDHISIHSNETIAEISVELCPISIYTIAIWK